MKTLCNKTLKYECSHDPGHADTIAVSDQDVLLVVICGDCGKHLRVVMRPHVNDPFAGMAPGTWMMEPMGPFREVITARNKIQRMGL